MFFDDMGITVACPLRVHYITDTDDLNVRGFISGTGYARLMTSVNNNISTLSYPRSDVFSKGEIELNYNNITGVNSKLDASFWDFDVTGYHKIYDKVSVSGAPRCAFYYITGSSNLNVSKNSLTTTFTYDINKVNISGLSNYYDKTYINTNYYDRVSVDLLLNTPARLHYAGFIASTGVINRDNGFYTFSVNKTGTGVYQILFNTAMPNGNYSVCCTVRNSTGGFCSYSNQNTTSVTFYTYTTAAVSNDIGFSSMLTYA